MDNTYRLVLERLESYIAPRLNDKQKDKREDKGEYEFISLPFETFIKQLDIIKGIWAKQYPLIVWPGYGAYGSGQQFVDVGCGIGTKMLAAKEHLYCRVSGIENHKPYATIAKKLVYNSNIIIQDALTVDYSSFDIIYFYCPLQDIKKQKTLEERIIDTAKSGAYILANIKRGSIDIWNDRLKLIFSNGPTELVNGRLVVTDPDPLYHSHCIYQKL